MSQQIDNTTATEETLRVSMPSADVHSTITAQAAGELVLDFDQAQLDDMTRSGDDLVFHFENGASVTVSNFFGAAREGDMSFNMPDGASVSARDFLSAFNIEAPELAAGPGAGAGTGGAGEYRSDPGAFTDGVDRLSDQGTFYWGRSSEPDRDDQGQYAALTIGVGQDGSGLFLSTHEFNESGSGLSLNLSLSIAAPSTITVTFQLSDGVQILQQIGLDNEYRADVSLPGGSFPGGSYVYDPASNTLTVTLPAGSTGVTIPIDTFDDHIDELAESLTFTIIDTSGPVTGGTGQSATVNFIEDNQTSHEHLPGEELFVKDGPIVGLSNVGQVEALYEGSPNGNIFTVGLNLTDPHSGDPYNGYKDSGKLSQDMTITVGSASGPNGARYGVDFEYDQASLDALAKVEGVSSVTVNPDGTITIVLSGLVQADGVTLNAPSSVFKLGNVSDLHFDIRVLINSEAGSNFDAESKEEFTVGVISSSGNESQGAGLENGANFVIENDPYLSLEINVKEINDVKNVYETPPLFYGKPHYTFPVTLTFDKDIADSVEFKAVINLGGKATLWDGNLENAYLADCFLPGTVFKKDGTVDTSDPAKFSLITDSDGVVTGYSTTDGNGVTYTYDFASNSVTVSGQGSHFDAADHYYKFDFIINDDHIGGSEKSGDYNENITLELGEVTLNDGYSGHFRDDDGNGLSDTKNTGGGVGLDGTQDGVVIKDDGSLTNWDGPRVGITVSNGTSRPSLVTSVKEEDNAELIFNITMKEGLFGSKDYAGYNNSGVLSQDMVLKATVITTGHAATYGEDYSFDFSKLDTLQNEGVLTYSFDNGVITIKLNGLTNADGVPYDNPARKLFDLDDIKDLQVTAKIINDSETELVDEHITLKVESEGGLNESFGTGVAGGTIKHDDPELFNGPTVSLTVSSINESDATDGSTPMTNAPVDNLTGLISIKMTGGENSNGTADESIPMTLVVGGGNAKQGMVSGGRDADTDYYLLDASGNPITWVQDADKPTIYTAEVTFTLTGGPADAPTTTVTGTYTYDSVSGKTTINFEMKEGYSGVDIKFAAKDDLFEDGAEKFEVNLTLDEKGGSGLPYGEAHIDGLTPGASASTGKTVESVITPDTRPAEGDPNHLNPADFDGPWVHLSVDNNKVYESPYANTDDQNNQNVAPRPTSVTYTVSLHNPDRGNTDPALDAYNALEDVTVTLRLTGVSETFHTSYNNNYMLGDLELDVRAHPDGGGKLALYDAKGEFVGEFIANSDGSVDIKVTVEKGQSEVELELKVNDDPLGASDASLHDKANEDFKVEIVDVHGNEARVDSVNDTTSQTVTIVDDVKDDHTSTKDDSSLEGIGLGLTWAGKTDSHHDLQEGNSGRVHVTVDLPGGKNPYLGYTTDGSLPDKLVLTFSFADTAANTLHSDDIAFVLDGSMRTELIKSGKATVSCYMDTDGDGKSELVTIDASNFNGIGRLPIDPTQPITITVNAGASLEDLSKVAFIVKGNADNISEWDKLINYKEDSYDNEAFGLTLTKVEGNETYIRTGDDGKQTNTVTGHVNDLADGALSWSGDSGTFAGTHWTFGVNVGYKDTESVTGSSNVPGEAVHFQLHIGNTAAMQNGEEFMVDSYALFLSMNKGNANLADFLTTNNITDLASYQSWLDKLDGTADGKVNADDNALLKACEGGKVILVYGDEAQWGQSTATDSANYDVYVPKGEFADGNVSFAIDTGATVAGSQNGFEIGLVDPYPGHHAVNGRPTGTPEFDMKGEIVYVGENPTVEAPKQKIVLSLSGERTIYEDADMLKDNDGNSTADTIASYNVGFAMYDEQGKPVASTAVSGDINFTLTFIPQKNVHFDDNLADNAYLDNWAAGKGVGDVGLNVASKAYPSGEYSSIDQLETMLQAWLDETYGVGKVEVREVSLTSSGQLVLDLTANEGFDLSKGIEIQFKALDDSVSDNNERFDVRLSNVSSNTDSAVDNLDVAISKDRQDYTNILDESNRANDQHAYEGIRNGFAVSLEDSSGFEASITGGSKVYVTARAYALDDTGNSPLSLKELSKYFEDSGLDGSMTLEAFIKTYYGPTQPIRVDYELDSDGKSSTDAGEDYVVSNSHTIPSGAWELVIDGNNVYFKARGNNGIPIETIKDYLTEGAEDLSITLTNTSGNESRPYGTGVDKEGNPSDPSGTGSPTTSANIDVLDVHDGPSIIRFGPEGGFVYEPIDKNHTDGDNSVVNRAVYTVKLDQPAGEDAVVWIVDQSSAGNADYYLGSGVYGYNAANGQVTVYNDDGTSSVFAGTLAEFLASKGLDGDYVDASDKSGNVLFTIIKSGDASASFNVFVRDDNDESAVAGGADDNVTSGKGEDIVLVITDVDGSEIMRQADYNNPDSPLIPWDSSASYEYSYTGGGNTYKGIVSPLEGGGYSFTQYDAAGKIVDVYTYGENGNPAWLPNAAPSAQGDLVAKNTIEDDMEGPEVSAESYAWTQGSGPVVSVAIQDVTGEAVTVTFDVINMNGDKVGSINYVLNSTGSASLTGLADIAALAAAQNVTLPNGDFYIQITNVVGGEAQGNSTPLFLDAPGGGTKPVPYIDHFVDNSVKEGLVPGSEGDSVSYQMNLVIPGGADIPKKITYELTNLNGSAGNDDYSKSSIEVTIDGSKLQDGVSYTVTITDNGYGAPIVTVSDSNGPIAGAGSATGKLPVALGDNKVEGNESFHTIITDCSVDIKDGVSSTTIIDQTFMTVVLMVPDGNGGYKPLDGQSYKENAGDIDVVAQLVMTDAAGNYIYTDGKGKYYTANDNGKYTSDDGTVLDTGKLSLVPVTATDPLQFEINYNSDGNDSADSGADYTGDQVFYIEAGSPVSKPITITVHDDYVSENNETFTVDVTLAGHDGSAYDPANPTTDNGMGLQYRPNNDTATVTIEEVTNGPVIKWGSSQSDYSTADATMSENDTTGYTIHFGSYSYENNSVRQVVEDDVTLTFKLTPKGDLSAGEDIAALVVDGKTFTVESDGAVSHVFTHDSLEYTVMFNNDGSTEFYQGGTMVTDSDELTALNKTLTEELSGAGVTPNADGSYTITAPMPEGSAMGSFTVLPKDDVKTELNDKFEIKLTGTHGSETSVAPGWEDSQTVTIKDDQDGYKYKVEARDGEEGGQAGVLVKLEGGQAPEEDVTFSLTVKDDAQTIAADGLITLTLPNGDAVEYDIATSSITNYNGDGDGSSAPADLDISWNTGSGLLKVTVPQAQATLGGGSKGLAVDFPLKDNSTVDADKTLNVTAKVEGGEIAAGNPPAYKVEFAGENGANALHGGQTEFVLTNTGGSVSSAVGSNTLSFSASDLSVVESIRVNDVTYKSGEFQLSLDGKSITINGVNIADKYEVIVTYTKGGDAEAIADAKTNLEVKATVSSQAGATVTVSDDNDTANEDPLTLSMAFDANAATVLEGGDFTGKFSIAGGDLSGDSGQVVGEITFKFTASPNPDGSYNTVTSNTLGATIGSPDDNGVYVVTVATNTALPLDIAFTVTTQDNSLAKNPEFEMSLVDGSFKAPAYEGVQIDTNKDSDSTTPLDAPANQSGPTFTVAAAPASVSEGGDVTFTLSSDSEAWGELPSGSSCKVAFTLTGLVEGDVISFGGSSYTVKAADGGTYSGFADASVGTGGVSADVKVETAELGGLNDGRNVKLEVTGVTDGTNSIFERVTGASATTSVTEAGADLDFTNGATTLTEGESITFSLALASKGANPATSSADMTVTFKVSDPDGALASTTGPGWSSSGGELFYTVTLPASSASIDVTLPLAGGTSDGLINGSNEVSITLDSFKANGAQVELDGIALNEEISYTVNDFDYTAVEDILNELNLVAADVEGMQVHHADDSSGEYDGSALTARQFIIGKEGLENDLTGGSGSDIIYGGQESDIIYGGQGSDIMNGGAGSDIFAWADSDYSNGAVDKIMDFSITEGDKLRFEGLGDIDTLLGGGITGDIDDGKLILNINDIANPQKVEVNFDDFTLTVNGNDYTSFDQFANAYNAPSADQETMMQILLQNMLITN